MRDLLFVYYLASVSYHEALTPSVATKHLGHRGEEQSLLCRVTCSMDITSNQSGDSKALLTPGHEAHALMVDLDIELINVDHHLVAKRINRCCLANRHCLLLSLLLKQSNSPGATSHTYSHQSTHLSSTVLAVPDSSDLAEVVLAAFAPASCSGRISSPAESYGAVWQRREAPP